MEKTLVIVKPDAFAKKYTWDIMKTYSDAGFDVEKIEIETPSKELCEKHYAEHKDKPFFNELVNFLSSGPVCAAVLKGDNVVQKVRDLNGDKNPQKAKPGTIRNRFGESTTKNAIHASDSTEHANQEISLWF